MPVYEYQCTKCQDIHEVQQSLKDDPLTACPKCEGAVKKLISRSSFQLKGGGWYADGYSGASNCGAKSTSAAKTDSGAKKDDSKPAGAKKDDSKPACPKAASSGCCS